MSHIPPTGHTYLDGLPVAAAGHASVLSRNSEALRDVLLHHARSLAFSDKPVGLITSRATVPVTSTIVLEVSPTILTQLEYADLDEYQDALSTPGFIHADDLDVVETHIANNSTAPYDARLKKASGGYVKWRIWGATMADPTDQNKILRFSVLIKV